jgi:hypothetical protein
LGKVHVADVDSDGNNDVLAALGTSNEITWYRNNGDNTYDEFTITTNVNGCHDLSMPSTWTMMATWMCLVHHRMTIRLPGTKTTAMRILLSTIFPLLPFRPMMYLPSDMDGDGDIDVLGASDGGNQNSMVQEQRRPKL